MNPDDNVSLFIGVLPGADRRQVVLFPDGHVIADLCEQEIDTGGYRGRDGGLVAASALIGALRDHGWHIEETTTAAAVWLKPGKTVTSHAAESGSGALAGSTDGTLGEVA
jgi:hypothetical protein